jgi:eukaryotic-like serine/threonine-protein kinase
MERTIAGRYAIGVRLGSGAMADVYAATDLRLDRDLAIKLVPEQGVTDVARRRFVREARAAARIAHPNAVAVYDAGNADGFLYLAMERVEGHTLAERLAHGGSIAVPEAVSIAGAVLDALGAAHAAGVVHRDVKPANIIVGPAGIKLVDFGIATLVGEAASNLTAAGDVVGTPKYLAPEQIAGKRATPETDLYALGVVLFEMLTGVTPFERGSPVATALAHRDEPAPDVRTIRPDVPPRVAAVVQTALRKSPTDRYSSAAEMGRMLAPAASPDYAGETIVLAAPDEMTSSRRGPRAWWLVAAAAVVIAGTVAVAAVVADGDNRDAATTSLPAGATPTASPTTTIPTTTAAPTTTTTAATTPVIATAPASIDGLIAVFAADPSRYGPATPEVSDRLDGIDNRGRKSRDRAAELLDDSRAWAEEGQLSDEAIGLLEAVLAPFVGDGNDEGDDEGDD